LRGGRDRLLDAYRTVKRTFLEANESLAQVEARAAVERSAVGTEAVDVASEIAAEIEKLDGVAGAEAEPGVEPEAPGDTGAEAAAESETHAEEAEVATALADVDTLFARLRAGHDEPGESGARAAEATPGTEPTTAVGSDAAAEAGEGTEGAGAPATELRSTQEWRALRAGVTDPLLPQLLKRAKRRAQDDQNALLDAVRRHKGRPNAKQVLGDADDARAAWAKVLREPLDRAYGAGRVAAGGAAEPVRDEMADGVVDTVVVPLRDRLTAAIDSGAEDPGGLVERIGARYREWKNQSLEHALDEALAAAWTRGVYDAVPDGAVLWWIPAVEGRCSDCDDNALEPTIKGEEFPTGSSFPPAHPGCTCLLAPSGMVEGR
jgi:hypothetical protein